MTISRDNPLYMVSKETLRDAVYKESSYFCYFSTSEETRFLFPRPLYLAEDRVYIPDTDKELAIESLFYVGQGENVASISPYYECKYSPYPLLLSARTLLMGTMSSILVIGGKSVWKNMLKNTYAHGNKGNIALEEDYRFPDLSHYTYSAHGITGRISNKKARWIFSGFFNCDLWHTLDKIALILVDFTSGELLNVGESDIDEILNYAESAKIPCIFYLRNKWDKFAEILKDKRPKFISVKPVTKSKAIEDSPPKDISVYDKNLEKMIISYNIRARKIFKLTRERNYHIERVRNFEQSDEIYKNFKYAKSLIDKKVPNEFDGNFLRILWRLITSVQSTLGKFKTTDFEIDGSYPEILELKNRLYDSIFKHDGEIKEALEDLHESVMNFILQYRDKLTPKGEALIRILEDFVAKDKTCTVVSESSRSSELIKVILQSTDKYGENVHVISYGELQNSPETDQLIFLNPPIGLAKGTLLTSTSNNLTILSYKGQEQWAEKLIKDLIALSSEKSPDDNELQDLEWRERYNINLSKSGYINSKTNENEIEVESRLNEELSELAERDYIDFDLSLSDFDDYALESEEYIEGTMTNDDFGGNERYLIELGGDSMVVPEDRKMVLVRDGKSHFVFPSKLRPGDIIMVNKGLTPKLMSEFVWEIMQKEGRIDRNKHPSNEWRILLRDYMDNHPELNYSGLYELLKSHGKLGIAHTEAISLWFANEDIIGPRDMETMQTIGAFLSAGDRWKTWWSGVREVRSLHNKLMRHLGSIAKYNSAKLHDQDYEDYYVDRRLKISISDISKYVVFRRVTAFPKRISSKNPEENSY